jgi:hypothetical protein
MITLAHVTVVFIIALVISFACHDTFWGPTRCGRARWAVFLAASLVLGLCLAAMSMMLIKPR